MGSREAQELADAMVPADASWRWNQGLMDLGAAVCRPRTPACSQCPVREYCTWAGDSREVDPARHSAATARRQGAFAGSDRQARGRLLRALAGGPLTISDVPHTMSVEIARAERLVADLQREGLIARRGDTLYLGDGPMD